MKTILELLSSLLMSDDKKEGEQTITARDMSLMVEEFKNSSKEQMAQMEAVFDQHELTKELWKISTHPAMKDLKQMHKTATTLTSKTMAAVKTLPETNKTFIICADGKIQMSFSPDMFPVGNLRADLEECHKLFHDKPMYCAYEVDLKRFQAGEKDHRVFRAVQMIVCDHNSSHEKNLLSTLVAACQEPIKSNMMHTFLPPRRPQKVLFFTEQEANDPLMKQFLSMMGCTNIGVVEPEVKGVLDNDKTKLKILRQQELSDKPYMNDFFRGIKCGNCEQMGPRLQKCPCGKAYYCNKECQASHWKMHKAEHKAAMKKKGKKEEKTKKHG